MADAFEGLWADAQRDIGYQPGKSVGPSSPAVTAPAAADPFESLWSEALASEGMRAVSPIVDETVPSHRPGARIDPTSPNYQMESQHEVGADIPYHLTPEARILNAIPGAAQLRPVGRGILDVVDMGWKTAEALDPDVTPGQMADPNRQNRYTRAQAMNERVRKSRLLAPLQDEVDHPLAAEIVQSATSSAALPVALASLGAPAAVAAIPTVGLFAGAQYSDALGKGKREGLSDAAARAEAGLEGISEGAWEYISDLALLGPLGRGVTKSAAKAISEAVAQRKAGQLSAMAFKDVLKGNLTGDFVKAFLVETGTELANTTTQYGARAAFGVQEDVDPKTGKPMTLGKQLGRTAEVAGGVAGIYGAVAAALGVKGANHAREVLGSAAVDKKARTAMKDRVLGELRQQGLKPEAAILELDWSAKIDQGLPIDLEQRGRDESDPAGRISSPQQLAEETGAAITAAEKYRATPEVQGTPELDAPASNIPADLLAFLRPRLAQTGIDADQVVLTPKENVTPEQLEEAKHWYERGFNTVFFDSPDGAPAAAVSGGPKTIFLPSNLKSAAELKKARDTTSEVLELKGGHEAGHGVDARPELRRVANETRAAIAGSRTDEQAAGDHWSLEMARAEARTKALRQGQPEAEVERTMGRADWATQFDELAQDVRASFPRRPLKGGEAARQRQADAWVSKQAQADPTRWERTKETLRLFAAAAGIPGVTIPDARRGTREQYARVARAIMAEDDAMRRGTLTPTRQRLTDVLGQTAGKHADSPNTKLFKLNRPSAGFSKLAAKKSAEFARPAEFNVGEMVRHTSDGGEYRILEPAGEGYYRIQRGKEMPVTAPVSVLARVPAKQRGRTIVNEPYQRRTDLRGELEDRARVVGLEDLSGTDMELADRIAAKARANAAEPAAPRKGLFKRDRTGNATPVTPPEPLPEGYVPPGQRTAPAAEAAPPTPSAKESLPAPAAAPAPRPNPLLPSRRIAEEIAAEFPPGDYLAKSELSIQRGGLMYQIVDRAQVDQKFPRGGVVVRAVNGPKADQVLHLTLEQARELKTFDERDLGKMQDREMVAETRKAGEVRSLIGEVQRQGGIKIGDDTVRDHRTGALQDLNPPPGLFVHKASAVGADTMAEVLGYEDVNDFIQALQDELETGKATYYEGVKGARLSLPEKRRPLLPSKGRGTTGKFSMPSPYNPKYPVVSLLTGNEVAENITAENAVEMAHRYFRGHLQGVPIHRDGLHPVRVTGEGWKKLRFGLPHDEMRVRIIPAIPDIIRYGNYHGRELVSKKRGDDIVAFHYFTGAVAVGKVEVQAGVSVGEDRFGNLFYNITRDPERFAEKRKAPLLPENAQGAEPSEGDSASGLNLNIVSKEDDVNPAGSQAGQIKASLAGPGGARVLGRAPEFSALWDRKARVEIDDDPARMIWKAFSVDPVDGMQHTDERAVLADVLKHPELFKAYPWMKRLPVRIEIDPELKKPEGSYRHPDDSNAHLGKISIFIPNALDVLPTLLHEVQHAIQVDEGMTLGSSPDVHIKGYQMIRKDLNDQIDAINEILVRESRENPSKDGFGSLRYNELLDERSRLVKEVEKIEGSHGIGHIEKGFDDYRRTAGEYEARDTAARFQQGLAGSRRRGSTRFEGGYPVPEESFAPYSSEPELGGADKLRGGRFSLPSRHKNRKDAALSIAEHLIRYAPQGGRPVEDVFAHLPAGAEYLQRVERAWRGTLHLVAQWNHALVNPAYALTRADKKYLATQFLRDYDQEGVDRAWPSEAVAEFARSWREVNDDIGAQAEALGIKSLTGGTEGQFKRWDPDTYVPHRLTDDARRILEMKEGPEWDALLEAAKVNGIDVRVFTQQKDIDINQRKYGSFDYARIANLPWEIEVDGKTVQILDGNPDILFGHIRSAARRLETVRQFGLAEASEEYLNEVAQSLVSGGGSTKPTIQALGRIWSRLQGRDVEDVRDFFDGGETLGYKAFVSTEAMTAGLNLSTAVIGNLIGGHLPESIRMGMMPTARAFFKAYTTSIKSLELEDLHNLVDLQGDLLSGMQMTETLDGRAKKLATGILRGTGFVAANRRINLAVAYAMQRHNLRWMLDAIRRGEASTFKRLWGQDEGFARRYLAEELKFSEQDVERMVLEGPTDSDLSRAIGKELELVNAMNESPGSRPKLVAHPIWRLGFAYSTFARKMYGTTWYAGREAKQGNYRPMATLLFAGTITGELIRAVRDAFWDREREEQGFLARFLEDMAQVATFGMLGGLQFGLSKISDKGATGESYKDLINVPVVSTPLTIAFGVGQSIQQWDLRPGWKALARVASAANLIDKQATKRGLLPSRRRTFEGKEDQPITWTAQEREYADRLVNQVYLRDQKRKDGTEIKALEPLPSKFRPKSARSVVDRLRAAGRSDDEIVEMIREAEARRNGQGQ